MSTPPPFDGRSYRLHSLHYSFGQKVCIYASVHLMPLLTLLAPSDGLNTMLWRMLGCRIGEGSRIRKGTRINAPFNVTIGKNCLIHGDLKAREKIKIGDGVELVEDVYLSTQTHNMDTEWFEPLYRPISIDRYAWLGPRSIVLAGATIGEGAVLAAGAIASRDLECWSVYVGVPARKIKERSRLKHCIQ